MSDTDRLYHDYLLFDEIYGGEPSWEFCYEIMFIPSYWTTGN